MAIFDIAEPIQIKCQDAFGNYIGERLKGYAPLEDFYRTAYVKEPIFHLFRYTPPAQYKKRLEELRPSNNFAEILQKEIEVLEPNIIVSFGELALQYLTGLKGIRKYRGSILKVGSIPLIPTLAPRDINKIYQDRVLVGRDLSKAHSFRDGVPVDCNTYSVLRSFRTVNDYFERNKDAPYVVTDIETHHGFITCMGFCCNGTEAVSIPLLEKNPDMPFIYRRIQKFLNSSKLVNQNIHYDQHYSERYGFRYPNIIGDTMHLGGLLYAEFPKNLGFYNSIYTNMPYFKDEGKEFDPAKSKKDQLYIYNAKDCASTWQCWDKMTKESKEHLDFYYENTYKFYFLYKKIVDRGIRVDETQREKLKEKYNKILHSYKSQLGKINYNSPKQIATLIYDELRLPKRYHTSPLGKKTLSTDELTIEYFLVNVIDDINVANILNAILYARKTHKLLTVLDFQVHPDGRLRTSYNLTGTTSGRTSTSHSLDFIHTENGRKNLGLPLQTIPKQGHRMYDGNYLGGDIRSIFVPSQGYSFIAGDLSQAEARVVAVLADDPIFDGERLDWTSEELESRKGLKDLCSIPDIHTITASLVLNIPTYSVTKSQREFVGKRTRHAANYGMQARTLAQNSQIPLVKAQQALDSFHKVSPNIKSVFHAGCVELLQNCRYLVTPYGRRRDFFGRLDESTYKVAYSYIPQSTISDHTKRSALYTSDDIEWLGEFHDGLLGEVPKGKEEKALYLLKEKMEDSIDFSKGSFVRDKKLKIPCELSKSSTNWNELKDFESE